MKKFCFIALASAVALGAGCGDDDVRPPIVVDSGPGTDGGTGDAGPGFDGGRPDTGVGGCMIGVPCDPARGCAAPGAMCQMSLGGPPIGSSAMDPIDGFDGTVTSTLFGDGYCTTAPVNLGMDPPSCDVDDPAACPTCSQCESLGSAGGIARTICARSCTPSMDSDECPNGPTVNNTCLLGSGFCLDGCNNDDQCRVFRLDTNDDGVIEAPGDGMVAVDRLTYLDTANHRCSPDTDRCVHDGLAAAEAGATCGWDGECEANGDCLYIEGWHDADGGRGYCSKFGCDVPGNGCAGEGKCQSRGFGAGFFLCVDACQVGVNVDTADIFSSAEGCRAGYRCLWDGVSGAADLDGGACIPGEFNEVRVANIGEDCTDETTCYSPFGAGACLGALRGDPDQCTLLDCEAPGMPADVCGAGNHCIGFPEATDSICRVGCTAADDCRAGEGCFDMSDMGFRAGGATCQPFCFGADQAAADAACRTGEVCDGFVPMMALGTCTAAP